ncbi:DUF1330 domain-containing protein [Aurantiacibacter marinus]|uniref:DUF1330 domain-containing protein n=1 Tax=Aurantiacibacter marinus TaxID=874156 RepID=UPI00069B39F6|nr:DUF1330 domain-containing protein [Aurantiacibacter marinus]
MPVFAKFTGKLMSIDEKPDVLEGERTHTHSRLIEFPDKVCAKPWTTSPESCVIAEDLLNASEGQAIMVEGLPPAA